MSSSSLLPLTCVLSFISPLLASSLSTPPLPAQTPSLQDPHSPHKSAYVTIHDNEIRVLNHFKVSFTHRVHGQLYMSVSDVTTSSIMVRWRLTNRTFNDSSVESMVICETISGIIVSKKVVTSSGSHRVEGLQSDKGYFICVYMLEKPPTSNVTVFHCNCHNATTIPVLRSDSIIGVLLTLGYIFLMAAIGYLVWRRRTKEVSEDKIRIADEEDEEDDDEEDGMERGGNFNSVVSSTHASSSRYPAGASSGTKHVTIASRRDSFERRNLVAAGRDHHHHHHPHQQQQQLQHPITTAVSVERSDGFRADGIEGERRGGGGGGADNSNGGCLDFRRSGDSTSAMLCGLGSVQAEMEDRRLQKQASSGGNRSKESSPVKVTEIAF